MPEQDLQIPHSRDPLHIIFDHLPDGLVLLDADGCILIANDAFCEDVLGVLPRAAIGRQYAALTHELEQSAQITIEPHPSIPGVRRARCAAGDGRQRWYDIDRYSVAAGDGAEQVIERWRDITRQEEQQRELLHDEQLTTMARLAANVVHEIGNPLQSVRSCIDLSREDRTLAATTAEYLELASSELRRMSHILSQLRDLYRLPLNEANNE
jgi:PAS domain S-box-containing protein